MEILGNLVNSRAFGGVVLLVGTSVKDELEEVKGEEKKQEKKDFEKGNLVFIEEKWYLSSLI